MWLFAMFDLPVTTKTDRKAATRFRKDLLDSGFTMLQFSVYARPCGSEDIAATLRRKIRSFLPSRGAVRLLTVTDRQFGKIENYIGAIPTEPEEDCSEQILLF